MINEINFDYFKTFYIVAKHGNITKASEVLYISQPAITQTIQKLENSLGVNLFIRNKKGVLLTPEGQKIFDEVENAYSHMLRIEKIVSDVDDLNSGTICIGCGSNIARKVLLSPILEFNKKYPNVNCLQIDKPQNIMFDMLSKCELDLCISQYNPDVLDKFNFIPILNEEFIFVCTNKYLKEIKNNSPLFIIQGDGTYNKKIFDNYIENQKIPHKVFQSVGYNFSLDLCLNHFGISLIPKYLVENYIKNNKLTIYKENTSNQTIYGIYTNKQIKSKKIDIFIDYLRNIIN